MVNPEDFPWFNWQGLYALTINVVGVEPHEFTLTPDSPEYNILAKCFALAIKILSHDDGKQALVDLGRAMVMGWAEENRHVFGGNIDEMPKYVDHFLERIVDFPVVTLSYLMPREVYAMTDRMDLWMMKASGKCQLTDYHPKDAAYLTYNYRKVVDLTQAYIARDLSAFTSHVFQFAMTTAHELVHVFGGYLALGNRDVGSYTPLRVRFHQIAHYSEVRGESGRWFEHRLLGGVTTYLNNPLDEASTCGHEYLFSGGKYFRVNPQNVNDIVHNLENAILPFPFRAVGPGLTPEEVESLGLHQI